MNARLNLGQIRRFCALQGQCGKICHTKVIFKWKWVTLPLSQIALPQGCWQREHATITSLEYLSIYNQTQDSSGKSLRLCDMHHLPWYHNCFKTSTFLDRHLCFTGIHRSQRYLHKVVYDVLSIGHVENLEVIFKAVHVYIWEFFS